MPVNIYASSGAKRYVGGTVRETTGKDITTATYQIGLSSAADVPPSSWLTPDVSAQGTTTAHRIVKLLVDNTTPVGTYWCWVKITDNPEVEPLLVQGAINVI